jgi:hypothetical protein
VRAINLDGVPDQPKEKRKRPRKKPAVKPTWAYATVTYATNDLVVPQPPRLVENVLTPEHVAATQNDPWQIRHRARMKYPGWRDNVMNRQKFPLTDAQLVMLVAKIKAGGGKLTAIETMIAEFIL